MSEDKKKDIWDKVNIIASLAIAAMVGYWGYVINARQADIEHVISNQRIALEKQALEVTKANQEFNQLITKYELELKRRELENASRNKDEDQLTSKLSVVQTLIPHISKDPQRRKVALIALAELGNNALAIKLAAVFPDQESKEAGDRISQSSESTEQESAPQSSVSHNITTNTKLKKGWIYLGRLSGNKWYGNYIDLSKYKSLSAVKDKIVNVKENVTGLNVRTNHPNIFGKIKPIITTLTPGSEVRIGELHHFTFNDFIWVNVEYSDSES